MQRIVLDTAARDIDSLLAPIQDSPSPVVGDGQMLIDIHAAGVNPSDVKAALGNMPHAVWPRTPGRDWAGVVRLGPADWVGAAVWGSGGELGIRRDGSHAQQMLVEAAQVRRKPASMTLDEAAGVGVPFITAYEGLRRAGMPQADEVVLVFGANGKVGQAAIQLATARGARVIGVERSAGVYRGHASAEVPVLDASSQDIAATVREMTGGRGADIVYNTVGSPYFAAANAAMAIGARQIFISTIERSVPFDIFAFYRGQHTFVGVDSLALDGTACARILDELAPAFETGTLRPFPITPEHVYALGRAQDAYRAVLTGARERVLIRP
ncbi:quinone oxidoreductase family protein [Burkholderia gladioli]|uniref:Oxidoreductase n=1 Tax=Burkholderia gladioli TaxID=28095 RepID=A0A2A7S8Y2_BURGA|nr:zinc-binding alcohol dehydrogenase family protein [Burkholderia gladioli]MBJ9663643.1 zinc-binding alcohol dehydrogenase family protein [Burkholderia gladioli]MBU9216434.1 zinc-binding alcohol dehydrogenase family protein [Burkholderia gladioli]MBU9424802.1 zinc-binding alcohol dehydrogenase family protein [Burkholderia gladioli]MDN7726305.1 zinc-binding alcohol dehydrogenase family protein [Burkholderia gladioli]MDN8061861.1 zinc-binding alcohol dehydrogenase family protein [Burkholderia g